MRCRPGTVSVRGGPGSAAHRSTSFRAAPHPGHLASLAPIRLRGDDGGEREPNQPEVLITESADVSGNVLNGPGRHENAADNCGFLCPFKPRGPYLLFRPHAMHAFVDSRADLENALARPAVRSTLGGMDRRRS